MGYVPIFINKKIKFKQPTDTKIFFSIFFFQNDDDPTDKPIIPSAKTFEQLIEEKLVDSPIHHEAQTQKEFDPKAPKPFLRRGSGLVRYGGVGGPKSLTPKLKRSQSYRGSKNSLNSKGDSR